MENKQIIIDGVNVSGCEHYDDLNCYAYRDSCGYPLDCKDNHNCYYKQLKRKEQECNQLEAENEQLMEAFEDITESRIEICNQCGKQTDYNIPCKQIRNLDYDLQLEIKENNKLKQVLGEIKKIIEWHITNADSEDVYDNMKQILKLISEVNDDRQN